MPLIESPCTGVCTLNTVGVCQGCGRTRGEIGAWSVCSSKEQREIVHAARQRLNGIKQEPQTTLDQRDT
ncbi:DUF1289 domain-containing protein [Stieleria varia]|uniref:DUF1289 domain-containing protein n=1 Tax=Stieleria varia TaxID=2528005 RepID=UPI0011B3D306|nr:DUF1289 domain-containing protein [Stieleria varia]